MENPIAVPSPVGEVIDVATPAARKLQALGLLWTVIALATFVFINYLIIESLAGDDPILSRHHPISFVGAPLRMTSSCIAWPATSGTVSCARARIVVSATTSTSMSTAERRSPRSNDRSHDTAGLDGSAQPRPR